MIVVLFTLAGNFAFAVTASKPPAKESLKILFISNNFGDDTATRLWEVLDACEVENIYGQLHSVITN